ARTEPAAGRPVGADLPLVHLDGGHQRADAAPFGGPGGPAAARDGEQRGQELGDEQYPGEQAVVVDRLADAASGLQQAGVAPAGTAAPAVPAAPPAPVAGRGVLVVGVVPPTLSHDLTVPGRCNVDRVANISVIFVRFVPCGTRPAASGRLFSQPFC